MHLLKHLYFQHISHQSSQREWWACQVHLSLLLLLYVDLISPFPEADFFFFFLVGVLTPLLALFRTPCLRHSYLLPKEPCVQSTWLPGWAQEPSAAALLTRTHAHTRTLKLYPQSHDNPRWVAEMFSVLRSPRPAEVTVTDGDKQNTDIHDPDLCQRVQTVQTEQKMDKQKQDAWRPQQLFYGHDREEPDSHLDPPSGLQEGSENKHHLREDERRVYLSLQRKKMAFRFRMHQVGPSKSGSAMKSALSSFLSVNTSSQLKQCRSVFFLFAYNRWVMCLTVNIRINDKKRGEYFPNIKFLQKENFFVADRLFEMTGLI